MQLGHIEMSGLRGKGGSKTEVITGMRPERVIKAPPKQETREFIAERGASHLIDVIKNIRDELFPLTLQRLSGVTAIEINQAVNQVRSLYPEIDSFASWATEQLHDSKIQDEAMTVDAIRKILKEMTTLFSQKLFQTEYLEKILGADLTTQEITGRIGKIDVALNLFIKDRALVTIAKSFLNQLRSQAKMLSEKVAVAA